MSASTDCPFEPQQTPRGCAPCEVIGANTSYDRQYVNKRIRNHLVPHGLAREYRQGLYQLTDRERTFLRGELDTEDLE